jgi:ABC-2 type transport system ATP-binding protein
VDVELRQTLWRFIQRLNGEGHTVVLTTHYLEEAEALCARIAMLKAGKVVALDTTANLLQRFAAHTLRFHLAAGELPADLAAQASREGRLWVLPVAACEQLETLLARLRQTGCRLEELQVGQPELEEVFMRLMHQEPVV